MNKNLTNTDNVSYSWSLLNWWNDYWSYHRVQYYSEEIHNYDDIIWLVEKWLEKIKNMENKDKIRLDIRVNIYDDYFLIKKLKGLKYDCSVKKFNWSNISQLIIWINWSLRKISEEKISEMQDYIKEKINNSLEIIKENWWFEKYALDQLERIKKMGYCFETENFTEDEIFTLWKKSFWWSKEEIKGLIKSNCNNIYWLRNNKWELVSLVLISDWETTEWATKEKYQKNWFIEPLLIFSNSKMINLLWKDRLKLYVHARHDRSIWPSIKTWMSFNTNNWLQFILTNHVQIDDNYQSFVEWVLDNELYTQKIIDSYLNYNK